MARILLTALWLLIWLTSAFSANYELRKGALSLTPPYATQAVAVKNNTNIFIKTVIVKCGFLRDNELLATGTVIIKNINPNQTAFGNAIADGAGRANRTQCLIVAAH
jgi:hypothetical protein